MKIALVFYGQCREVEESAYYIKKNLITPNNITDIHISTYNDVETKQLNTSNSVTSIGLNELKTFIDIYDPTVVDIINYDKLLNYSRFKQNRFTTNITVNQFNVQAMFYSMFKSTEQITDDFDLVVLTRTDICPLKPIDLSNLDPNIINTPDRNSYFTKQMLSDHFLVSNLKNIKSITNIWNTYEQLYNKGVHFHAETLMFQNVINHVKKIVWQYGADKDIVLARHLK